MKIQRYTAEQMESLHNEGRTLEILESHDRFEYALTPDEIQYFQWIQGRYSVCDLLMDSMIEHDDGTITVVVDAFGVSVALSDDGVDRLPCCSEDCMINRLVWFIGPEESN